MGADPDRLVELLAKIPTGEISVAKLAGLEPVVLQRLVDKAQAFFEQGMVDQGDRLLRTLCQVDNVSPSLPFLLGALRADAGDLAGARAAYDEAIVRADRSGATSVATKARLCRGQALAGLGAIEDARADFAALLDAEDPVGPAAKVWHDNLSDLKSSGG